MLDLRFLARRKALSAIAVLTMALALGANTAALSVLEAFLLSSLAVPESDRVVLIAPERTMPGRGSVVMGIGGAERVDHAGASEDAQPRRGLAGIEIAHDDRRPIGRPLPHDLHDSAELTVGARGVRRHHVETTPRRLDFGM